MASFRFSCPSCQGVLQSEDAMRGKQVRCPTCQHIFSVPAEMGPQPSVWYIARNKTKEGPYSTAQLRKLAASGQVRAQDMILREGHGKWLPASSIKGLLPPAPAGATPAPTPVPSSPPVAIFVGPTPPSGSNAPIALPVDGAISSAIASPDGRPIRRRRLWPWLVGAGTAAAVLIAVGVLALTGVFSRRSRQDLAFVAPHFNAVIVVHPRRAMDSEVLKKAIPKELLEHFVKDTKFDPRKVEEVMVLLEPPEDGARPSKGRAARNGPENAAFLPPPRAEEPDGELTLVQYRPEPIAGGSKTADQAKSSGSGRDQAVAWLRANNAFGARHRMVEQMAKALRDVDDGKAFFLRLGTRLVKSHKPTLLAGRNNSFQAFEVAPELAGKWIPERLTEFKTTAALNEVVEPEPSAKLDHLKFDNASGLSPDRKLTGSVAYRQLKPLEGSVGLRLTYMAGEDTHVSFYRFGKLLADSGTMDFAFPPLKRQPKAQDGPVPVFVELCTIPTADRRAKAMVRSNSAAALVRMAEGPGAEAEEEQQRPPRRNEPPFGFGAILRFSEPEDQKPFVGKLQEKSETKAFEGKKYFVSKDSDFNGTPLACYIADERTLVVAAEPTLHKMLAARDAKSPLIERMRTTDLNAGDVTGIVILAPYAAMARPALQGAAVGLPPDLADIKKLPDIVKAATAVLDLSGDPLLKVTLETDTADSAGTVQKLLKSGLDMAKGLYALARPQISAQVPPNVPPEAARMFLAIADQINGGVTISQDGNHVTISMKRPPDLIKQ